MKSASNTCCFNTGMNKDRWRSVSTLLAPLPLSHILIPIISASFPFLFLWQYSRKVVSKKPGILFYA